MLKAFCVALGLAAALCSSQAQAQLGEVRDILNRALQDTMALGQQRFADRTGGDQDFIEATREALRMTFDAMRDIGRINCADGIPAETTPEGRIDLVRACEIKKAETSHDLLNRTAHMWLGFKPPYGGVELLLQIRSNIRRYIRLAEDDSALYPDEGAWPGPRPAYDPESVQGASAGSPASVAALQAQVQQLQDFAAAASQALAAQGLTLPSQPAVRPQPPARPQTPTNSLRQLPEPGGER